MRINPEKKKVEHFEIRVLYHGTTRGSLRYLIQLLIALIKLGIWSEFSLMVSKLPEGWRLPSILTAVIQISQIGL